MHDKEIAPVSAEDFGLYVHFPYCLRVCPYCDFNVYAGPFDGVAYANSVIKEIKLRAGEHLQFGALRSIYFGGGTPSLWDTREIGRVIQFAAKTFGLKDEAEISLECNPERLSKTYLKSARGVGINRISLGTQSLVPKELVQLGRAHQARDSLQAIDLCKALGFKISVDVIFGTPDQTEAQLNETLDQLLRQPIDHLSSYSLTIEEDTAFARQEKSGKFVPMSDDDQADRMEQLCAKIRAAGFAHYEVSAYGKGTERAIHNSLYWVNAPFVGVGAGAHSYRPATNSKPAVRRVNIKNPVSYMVSSDVFPFPAEQQESLGDLEVMTERLMVGTRVKWGIDISTLPWGSNAGIKLVHMRPVIKDLCETGLLSQSGNHIWPTEKGLMFADSLARKLVGKASELLG